MNSATYYGVYYNSKHMTYNCCHLKQDPYFVKAENRYYVGCLGMEDVHHRQTPGPAGRCSPPT